MASEPPLHHGSALLNVDEHFAGLLVAERDAFVMLACE